MGNAVISAEIAELARQAMLNQGIIPPASIGQSGRAKLHEKDTKESVQYNIFENPDGSVVLNLHSFNSSYELQNVQLVRPVAPPSAPAGGKKKGPKSPFNLYVGSPSVRSVPQSVAAQYLRNRGISDATISVLADSVKAVAECGYYVQDDNRNYKLLAACPAILWGHFCATNGKLFKTEAIFLSADGRKNDAIRAAGQPIKKQRRINKEVHCSNPIAPLVLADDPRCIGVGEGIETSLSLHTLGMADAVYCTGGAGKLDAVIEYLLDQFPTAEIRVAYDDKATDESLGKLKSKLAREREKLLRVKVLRFLEGDANDHLQAGYTADEVEIEPLLGGEEAEFELVKFDKAGEVQSITLTKKNLKVVLKRLDHPLPVYDEMLHKARFLGAGDHEDADNAYVSDLTDELLRLKFTKVDRLPQILRAIAIENSYHPVRQWLEEAEWDGKDGRVDKVLESIVSPIDSELKWSIIKRWLYQVIAALYPEYGEEDFGITGRRYEGVLVFSGRQGAGKTRWFKSLLPIHDAVKDGVTLRLDSKDSQIDALSALIVELGEIDSTFRKSDIEALKAFLSKTTDEIRRPYDREPTQMKRRTVFAGTVNDAQFLNDPTGNRRFWVIPVKEIRPVHEVVDDVRQFWLEVFEMFKFERNALKEQGLLDRPVHVPTDEELKAINEANAEHLNLPPIVEKFLDAFYDTNGKLKVEVAGTQVLSVDGIGGVKVYPHEKDLTVKQILEVLDVKNASRAETTWLRNYLTQTLGAQTRRTKHGQAYTLPREI